MHETGHFLAARLQSINVTEFSVGLGPRLLCLERGGIEFSLRAVPVGGYVRFPENYDREEAESIERGRGKAFEKRVAEVREERGLLGLIKWLNEDNEDYEPRKVKETNKDNWTFEKLRNKLRLPSQPKKEVETQLPREITYNPDPRLLQNRPPLSKALVMSMGVIFNLLLSLGLYTAMALGPGLPQPVLDPGIVVERTPSVGSPASGKLQAGDVIVGVNGRSLRGLGATSVLEATVGIDDFIEVVRSTPEGDEVEVSLQRAGVRVSKELIPTKLEPNASPTVGVSLRPNVIEVNRIKAQGIPEALREGAVEVRSVAAQTAGGLLTYFASFLPSDVVGGTPIARPSSVSGPLGVLRVGSDVASTGDLFALASFAAAISVNLAVVNSLPLPALDGGQLAFVIAEVITGKKVETRKQEEITAYFLLLLVLASLGTFIGDIEAMLK